MLTTPFRVAPSRAALLLLAHLLITGLPGFVSGKVLARSPYPKKRRAAMSEIKIREPGTVVESERLRILAFRLRPDQDLRQQIEAFVKARKVRAGFILTAVGSLRTATIRLADQKDPTTFAGKFEIVSLVGTMGQGGVHLHISIADRTGKTIGGHLVDGCLVYTTAEIVVGEARGLTFSREQDEETGYKEIRIRRSRD